MSGRTAGLVDESIQMDQVDDYHLLQINNPDMQCETLSQFKVFKHWHRSYSAPSHMCVQLLMWLSCIDFPSLDHVPAAPTDPELQWTSRETLPECAGTSPPRFGLPLPAAQKLILIQTWRGDALAWLAGMVHTRIIHVYSVTMFAVSKLTST